MRNMKKAIALSMATLMAVSATACGSSSKTSKSIKDLKLTNGGKVLRIYCWNEEIQSRFADYVETAEDEIDGTKIEWVVTANKDNAYQKKLDEALKAQPSKEAKDRVDMYLIEADYALKYVNSDYSVDVKDLGLTDDDLKDQYQYTKDICTNDKGELKAVSWQATPGLFAYRRSIAKDVLGTDDPEEVQKSLASWEEFDKVAAKAHEKGYKMLSGYDDAYRVFSNNVSSAWVNDKKEVVIDDNIMKWVDQTKTYTENGYNNKSSLWDDTWNADQGSAGKVFGFFYSTWGINFTLLGNSLDTSVEDGGKEEVGNGAYGDYAVCQGPESYYWGGSWLVAAPGSDNKDLICDIMKKLTCDKDTMKKITEDTQDYTNNISAMEELAASDFHSAFLGGQNHIALFAEAAPKIDMSNTSAYDQGCNEEFQTAMREYFDGNVTKEEAIENFYKAITKKYPELKKPE